MQYYTLIFAIIKLHLCHARLKYTWDASFNYFEVRVKVSLLLNKEEQKQVNKKEKVTESLHLTVEMVKNLKNLLHKLDVKLQKHWLLTLCINEIAA